MRVVKWGTVAVTVLASVAACSKDAPPPPPPPQPTATAVVVPEPPAPEPVPEPVASATTDGPEVAPKPPRPSGRPAILMGPTKEIASTFGLTPGAVLKLKGKDGNITLKFAEFSLKRPANINWKVVTKRIKTKGMAVGGMIARIDMTRTDKPGARQFFAGERKFELRWPLGKESSVNLAIGTQDASTIQWRVVAPTKVETGFKEAYFELDDLGPVQYFHATLSEPTAAPDGG